MYKFFLRAEVKQDEENSDAVKVLGYKIFETKERKEFWDLHPYHLTFFDGPDAFIRAIDYACAVHEKVEIFNPSYNPWADDDMPTTLTLSDFLSLYDKGQVSLSNHIPKCEQDRIVNEWR